MIQHFKVIFLLSVFVLFVFGCATNKSEVTDAGFGLTAEVISEGILLIFYNIPPDSIRLFISIQSWDDTGEFGSYHMISSFADIRDASFLGGAISSLQLERIKGNGRIIFPIVQAGQKYTISASIQTRYDIDNDITPTFIYTEIIAENGIYFNREDLQFEVNETNTAVTLHSVPVFSSDVVFCSQKIGFSVFISVGESRSISVATHHIPDGLSSDGLTWTFEPQMTDNLRENNNNWLQSGNYYPAWARAYANIIHDGIIWSVEIAKTPVFNFSL